MRVHCNVGWTVTNMIGQLPGYPGEVWYNPDGIPNILSLANAKKHFCIKYDSSTEKAFIIEKPDGMEKCFIKNPVGLYYLDTATDSITNEQGMTLIMTVEDKQSKYMVRGY
jgi:hypothetical protein